MNNMFDEEEYKKETQRILEEYKKETEEYIKETERMMEELRQTREIAREINRHEHEKTLKEIRNFKYWAMLSAAIVLVGSYLTGQYVLHSVGL